MSHEEWVKSSWEPDINELVVAETDCPETPYAVFMLLENDEGDAMWWRHGDCMCEEDLLQYGFDYCSPPVRWKYICPNSD